MPETTANETSGLKQYGLGVVVRDKPDKSDYVEVYLPEQFPLTKGAVSETSRTITTAFEDSRGVLRKDSVITSDVIVAKWLGLCMSNRESAPDVYRNESVAIYKFADDNTYYWTTLTRESALRGREDVLYRWSNKDAGKEVDDDNSHWLRINAKDQKVQFHTSDNSGESTTYDISLDLAKGIVTIADGHGNSLELNSPDGTLEGTIIEKITLNTKKMIFNAETSVEINTPTYTLNGQTSTINVTNHTENAASSITNGLSVVTGSPGAAVSMEGSMTMKDGNLTMERGDLNLQQGSATIRNDLHVSGHIYGETDR